MKNTLLVFGAVAVVTLSRVAIVSAQHARTTQISANSSHNCARLSNGEVRCWGLNDSGQLGDDGTTSRATAARVSGIASATSVSVGLGHSCAVLADRTVRCWG